MSFLSVEPQSRVLLESHSNSLLAQIDTQLQIIADRYLAFFQERRIIETTYIDSLRELHHKAKAVDASFDPRAEPTTTRTAWDKVRDNLEREASSQQAFVDILDNDVIKPLVHLKESTGETRKRIEEELKGSAAKYASLAENKIAKLQQAYIKKYHHQQYADSTDDSQRPEDIPNKRFGDKFSTLFRGRREDLRRPEHPKSEEVSDDTCRWNVARLNGFRLKRVENLSDGYNCLEELVFTPTVKDVLVKYMDACSIIRANYDELETNTRAEVEKSLAGTDMSDLRASFRRALSFSIPPRTLYHNYRPGEYSDLIFGVPLVDVETNEGNVPKVMRMCIEEVEKRGLNTNKIYSVGSIHDAEVLELRRRFESEKTFSFSSTDKIHSVAVLLTLYLLDLPEPLFMLSLQEYRNYRENRARYIENDFSVLRSKIRELHPVHGASLEALLRHLLRVSSHSDENAMTLEALAAQFCYTVLRGNQILQDGVHVKTLVMADLIQNVHTLFDERPSLSPPAPSPDVAEATSIHTYGSLFLSPELPQTMGSAAQHRPVPFGGTPTLSTRSSLSPDPTIGTRLTPSPTPLLSPLLGFPTSQTLTERVETTTQEQVISKARSTKALETLGTQNSTSTKAVLSVPPTSVTEWWLRQSQLPPHPEAVTTPRSPPESVLSSTSEFPLSSATSLRSRIGGFSP
ncbi:hypothetical protein EDB86DRAFT_1914472 [Lactarius hatsudake]|nr:hypothetical protein EDB86DRAFT_1914472 [Lactarius hatsudake]